MPPPSCDVDVVQQGLQEEAVGRVECDEADAITPEAPLAADRLGLGRVQGHVDRCDVVGERPRVEQRLYRSAVDAAYGKDDAMASHPGRGAPGFEGKVAFEVPVVMVYAEEEGDEGRDQQDDEPRPVVELGHREHQGHDRGAKGSKRVDDHLQPPALLVAQHRAGLADLLAGREVPELPPASRHSRLGKSEGEEDADGVERDQDGVFDRFWFWTVDYAREYGGEFSLLKGFQTFVPSVTGVIGTSWPLWALSGIGLIAGLWNKRTRAGTQVISVLLVFSVLGLCSGLHFRNHYFILVLPALSLLVAVVIAQLCDLAGDCHVLVRFMPILVFCGALTWPIYSNRDVLFRLSPIEVCRTIYSANPFVEAIQIAEYIRDRTTPDDRIAILGSEPEIYFYAQRRSATGYIYTYSLVEEQKYALNMQHEMVDEIETAKPKYLIVVGISSSWLSQPGSDHPIFDWITNYTSQNYTLVGLVHMVSPERTSYYFQSIPTLPSADKNVIFINERKL